MRPSGCRHLRVVTCQEEAASRSEETLEDDSGGESDRAESKNDEAASRSEETDNDDSDEESDRAGGPGTGRNCACARPVYWGLIIALAIAFGFIAIVLWTGTIWLEKAPAHGDSPIPGKAPGNFGAPTGNNASGSGVTSEPSTPAMFDKDALNARQIFYVSLMGCVVAGLTLSSCAVAYRRRGRLEIPFPRVQLQSPEMSARIVGVISANMLALGLGIFFFALDPMRQGVTAGKTALLCGLSILSGLAGAAFTASRSLHITWEVKQWPDQSSALLPRAARMDVDAQGLSLQGEHSAGEDQGLQDESVQALIAEEEGARDTAEHVAARRRRKAMCFGLLVVYASTCIGIPWWQHRHVSCTRGFFWEAHLLFFATWAVTKGVELMLYFSDPSLDGELPVTKFLLLFLPSFLGYADAYQDATAIAIAHSCAERADTFDTRAESAFLSRWMAVTYVGGVVCWQWLICGTLALRFDPSGACLAKVLHMDVVAASISIPPEVLWLWWMVNFARTFGEDVWQAYWQWRFVTNVKQNAFMVVSIVFSVLASLKALYDACSRVSQAVGRVERLLKEHLARQRNDGREAGLDSWSDALIQSGWSVEDDFVVEHRRILGEGGYASVVAGKHKTTGDERAIKCITKEMVANRDRLLKEIRIVNRLDHPNINKFFQAYEDRRFIYLVLELCSGGELFDRIQELGHFSEREACICMRQIFHVIDYVHGNGVVHRDVKPENFLFKWKTPIEGNVLQAIDFGIAGTFEPGKEACFSTRTGTPYYVAPEVLQYPFTQYGKECDLWSCGVVMYVTLSGRLPFRGVDDNATFAKVKKAKIDFPDDVFGNVSDSAKTLVRGLLAKDPSQRYTANGAWNDEWTKSRAPSPT